jgi:hypothetical protein
MARGPLAGAAGPGKFSKRTDLNMNSIAYGEGAETQAIKSGAPLAKTPNVNPVSRSEQGIAPSQLERITPLFAPTQRPEEPITTGIAMGAGAGPEVLGMRPQMTEKYSDTLAKLLPYDESGEIAVLYQDFVARGL